MKIIICTILLLSAPVLILSLAYPPLLGWWLVALLGFSIVYGIFKAEQGVARDIAQWSKHDTVEAETGALFRFVILFCLIGMGGVALAAHYCH